MLRRMIQLDCQIQMYAWGKNGSESTVANLKRSSDGTFVVREAESYAELWMGTHPSGPSRLVQSSGSNSSILLSDWLKNKPSFVGRVPESYPEDDLPFLFKVLSVKTALSIQAHPNKELAAELYKTFPNIYKDPNHKPEMAIALTDFECLCGFRPADEINQNLVDYPELKEVTRSSNFGVNGELKDLFTTFMRCPDDVASTQLRAMVQRLEIEVTAADPSEESSSLQLKSLLLRLHSQYPGDRGVFCPLIMNYLKLNSGESFFIGANEPHAYISGDCVECMALSDNVVRAGLTPKFKDVETLCGMLNYSSGKPSLLIPVKLDDNTFLYRPPYDSCAEFEVEIIRVPAKTLSYNPPVVGCGSVLLVMSGEGLQVTASEEEEGPHSVLAGSVYFLLAGQVLSIRTSDSPAVIYRAHVNLGSAP